MEGSNRIEITERGKQFVLLETNIILLGLNKVHEIINYRYERSLFVYPDPLFFERRIQIQIQSRSWEIPQSEQLTENIAERKFIINH